MTVARAMAATAMLAGLAVCGPGSCLTFRFRLVLYGAGTRFR